MAASVEKVSVAPASRLRRSMPTLRTPKAIPILSYHQVTPRPHPEFRKYSVTPRQLATHLRWLRRRGYESIDLARVAGWLDGKDELPPRPVVLTFDDGFRDAATYAAPVLQASSFTAIFFVVAGLVGKNSAWLVAERGFEAPLIDWETLSDLRDKGFEIGSHAVSHPRLSALSSRDCRSELVDARVIIEQNLGAAVEHLAYPFGSWNERVRSLARDAGYTTACTTDIALTTRSDQPLSLPRVPVVGTEPLSLFAWRLRLAHAPRDVARSLLARSKRLLHRQSSPVSLP